MTAVLLLLSNKGPKLFCPGNSMQQSMLLEASWALTLQTFAVLYNFKHPVILLSSVAEQRRARDSWRLLQC